MGTTIQRSIFAVGDKAHCAWGWDLGERNVNFIADIDEGYFEYVGRLHYEHLEGENAQRAAIALRVNYHLCLETLFGLIGAAVQAPDCVVGWVLKASTSQIRNVVEALRSDRMRFPAKWDFGTPNIGFNHVARLVFQYASWARIAEDKTTERFEKLWRFLAIDFLDAFSIKEYNSIKHGFRARSGGFTMRIGVETEYGVAPPPEKMNDLGGSQFGTSFYSVERVKDSPSADNDPHFFLRHNSVNWLPDATAGRMLLAALSIKNIKSFLAIANGKAPQEVQFSRPQDPADFETPWQSSPGILSCGFDLIVSENDIERLSKSELSVLLGQIGAHKKLSS